MRCESIRAHMGQLRGFYLVGLTPHSCAMELAHEWGTRLVWATRLTYE